MKLSYFSYDFSACFCEAVNAGVLCGYFSLGFCCFSCCVALLYGPAGVPGAGCVGPGCFVCPWAAARPRVVRAASRWLGASARSPARPRHRPRAPQPGPPFPPAPSTPVEPGVLLAGSARWLEARLSPPSPSPPLFLNHTQFRMQFPRYPLKPRIHNVGIATFSDSIETSPNRITCDFSEAVPATTHECRSHALTRGMGPQSHRGTPRPQPPLPASLHERSIDPARRPTA